MNEEQVNSNETPVKGYAVAIYVPFDFAYSGEFKDLNKIVSGVLQKEEVADDTTWSEKGKALFSSSFSKGGNAILQRYTLASWHSLKNKDDICLLGKGAGQSSSYEYRLNIGEKSELFKLNLHQLKLSLSHIRVWFWGTGRCYAEVGVFVRDADITTEQLLTLKKCLYGDVGYGSSNKSCFVPYGENTEDTSKFTLTDIFEAFYKVLQSISPESLKVGHDIEVNKLKTYMKRNKRCASYLVFEKSQTPEWIEDTLMEYCGENADIYTYTMGKPVYSCMQKGEFDIAILSDNSFGYKKGKIIKECGFYARFFNYFILLYLYYDYLSDEFNVNIRMDKNVKCEMDNTELYLADVAEHNHYNIMFVDYFCVKQLKMSRDTVRQLQELMEIYSKIATSQYTNEVPDIAMKNNRKEPYVFISYSHRDYKKVYKILADMRRYGINFVYDKGFETSGLTAWKEEAYDMMNDPNCIGVMFFMSDKLFASESVYREIQLVNGERVVIEGHEFKLDNPDKFMRKEGNKIIRNYFSVNISDGHKASSILLRDAINSKTEAELNGEIFGTAWIGKVAATFSKDITFLYSNSDNLVKEIDSNINKIKERKREKDSFVEEVAATRM